MGRKSKAEERKKEILESFYVVLKEEGYENASIGKIAEHMDVNPSLLIHYFKTKEEIVVAFVDFLLNKFEDTFKNDLLNSGSPKERFNIALGILYGERWLLVSDQTVFYACYYLTTRNNRIRDRFKAMYKHFVAFLTPYIEDWMKHQIIRNDMDPKSVAEYMIIQNEGLTYYDKLQQDPSGFLVRSRIITDSIRSFLCR